MGQELKSQIGLTAEYAKSAAKVILKDVELLQPCSR